MKSAKLFFLWCGIYTILESVWIFFEELETGYAVTTITDSVICAIITTVLVWVLWSADEPF